MTSSVGTANNDEARGEKKRAQFSEYNQTERQILREKLLGENWRDMSFLGDFWNVVHDEGDVEQYRRMALSWQLQSRGVDYKQIAEQLQIHHRKTRAYVRGDNCRPNLAAMFLNRQKLGQPREGWKWILDCTPKPTDPYPRALQVPERINNYNDILQFLEQFSPVSPDSEALRFFGLTSEWAMEYRAELFWFLMAFLVGDGGKYYSDYARGIRHYRKTQFTTIMSLTESNFRVLRFVQLALDVVGIPSHQIKSDRPIIRWNSEASNILTWILQVCIGLKEGERTSIHPINMPWLKESPKNLIIGFLQGLADSDGSVDKNGYYAVISSVPNSSQYADLFRALAVEPHLYPSGKPQQVRILLRHALEIPLFNPIIRSYRQEQLIQHAIRRGFISGSTS